MTETSKGMQMIEINSLPFDIILHDKENINFRISNDDNNDTSTTPHKIEVTYPIKIMLPNNFTFSIEMILNKA
jgi:predicted transcriptional regulator